MSRRLKLILALLAFAAVVAGGWWAREGSRAEEPNVALVVLDTVRADRLAVLGYARPTSPFLEQLAPTSLIYETAWTPGTWTLPVHGSLFTGEPPEVHGAHFVRDGIEALGVMTIGRMRQDLPTLAERFSARGYRTISVSQNPLLVETYGVARGFDSVDAGAFFGDMKASELLQTVRRRLPWTSRPTFLFVNIAEAHGPYDAIPPGVDGFAPESGVDVFDGGEGSLFGRFVRREIPEPERRQIAARLSRLYDYGVLQADQLLEELVALLESAGWDFQRDLLVVTSDHGEYLGEHGLLDHGRYPFDENNRSFVLVHGGPVATLAPARIERPAASQQLYGTVLELAGLDAAGEPHLPLPGTDPGRDRPLWSVSYPDRFWSRITRGEYGAEGVLRLDLGDERAFCSQTGRIDEGEPRLLAACRERLERTDWASGEAAPMDDEMREAMEAVGYL